MKHHENLHSGEKPHQCKTCAKSFAHSASLEVHKRTHTGEKPYKCPTCNRCFAGRGTFVQHIKRHRNGKPYQCQNCNIFFEMSAFAEHVKKSEVCADQVITKIGVIY